jgi:DNA-binding transcriptional ArsR family regulator
MATKRFADIPAPSDLLERVAAEIDARLAELRPAVEEQIDLLRAAEALGLDVVVHGADPPRRKRGRSPGTARRGRPPSVPRGVTQQAIVDALEHGSHTLSELVVVTAQSTAAIRQHVATLLDRGVVTRARREGKSAYTLTNPPS